MLSNIKPDDAQKSSSDDATSAGDDQPAESAAAGDSRTQKSPAITLFPQTDQELNTSILTNFNQLLTTLTTPPHKATQLGARVPKAALSEHTRPSTASAADTATTHKEQSVNCKTSDSTTESSTTAGIKPLMSEDIVRPPQQSTSNVASNANPFFHIPGVGLANPFLATFIERQIRNHLQAMQQLNVFAFQLQAQRFQQQQQQQQMQGNSQECIVLK